MDTSGGVPAMLGAYVLADCVLVGHAATRHADMRVLRGGERSDDE